MKDKKLYKLGEGKVIDGVCGGVAEYIGIDPTVVRVIWAMLAFGGFGIFAYIVCMLIMPRKPSGYIDV